MCFSHSSRAAVTVTAYHTIHLILLTTNASRLIYMKHYYKILWLKSVIHCLHATNQITVAG